MNNEQLWQAILGEVELSLSKANFTTWFKSTFISSKEDNTKTLYLLIDPLLGNNSDLSQSFQFFAQDPMINDLQRDSISYIKNYLKNLIQAF